MADGRRLPDIVVIGAMKCGTTAVHDLLDRHPHIAMSQPKELNFFFGPDNAAHAWAAGNWSHGVHWYTRQFDLDAPLLGESSPGYTSPAHPCVAQRMAAIVPDAKLLYLVRDPIIRAISQYEHHRADDTEHRALAQALTDPTSQYIARGRYSERLQPFLAHYPRAQIMIVVQEDLRDDPATTLRAIFTFVGADPSAGPWTPSPQTPTANGCPASTLPCALSSSTPCTTTPTACAPCSDGHSPAGRSEALTCWRHSSLVP